MDQKGRKVIEKRLRVDIVIGINMHKGPAW